MPSLGENARADPRADPRVDPRRDEELDALLRAALAEDVGAGDVTSTTVVPAELVARGTLVAKATGVVAGLAAFVRVFELLDGRVRATWLASDGDPVEPGRTLVVLEGPARTLLAGERTALNVVQHLSGVATLTARFVERAGPGVAILDTRKTLPGLRRLEKLAVRAGGGLNHRMGLWDEAMIKNNHVDLARRSLAELVGELRRAHGPGLRITAEARDRAEALAAVEGGADVVLLDNLDPPSLARLVPELRRAAESRGRPVRLEASGGIDLGTVAAFAASGIDRISVGALTHSAPALDLSLRLEAQP